MRLHKLSFSGFLLSIRHLLTSKSLNVIFQDVYSTFTACIIPKNDKRAATPGYKTHVVHTTTMYDEMSTVAKCVVLYSFDA